MFGDGIMAASSSSSREEDEEEKLKLSVRKGQQYEHIRTAAPQPHKSLDSLALRVGRYQYREFDNTKPLDRHFISPRNSSLRSPQSQFISIFCQSHRQSAHGPRKRIFGPSLGGRVGSLLMKDQFPEAFCGVSLSTNRSVMLDDSYYAMPSRV